MNEPLPEKRVRTTAENLYWDSELDNVQWFMCHGVPDTRNMPNSWRGQTRDQRGEDSVTGATFFGLGEEGNAAD